MACHSLLGELQQVQLLLAGGGGATYPDQAALLLRLHEREDDSEEDTALAASSAAKREQLMRLQQEAAGLKQKVRHEQEECERLRATAARDREDSGLIIERLQAQLLQQRAESKELSELVLALRGENDTLQRQLQGATVQAQQNERDTAHNVQQLSTTARQWRRQHEEVMRQLMESQEQQAALHSELRLVRQQLQAVEGSLDAEQRERQRAATKCAALEAAFGAHGKQQAELKSRLKTERTWRKATQAWLQAELHTKNELERLLVNVGVNVRLGPQHTVRTPHDALAPQPKACTIGAGPVPQDQSQSTVAELHGAQAGQALAAQLSQHNQQQQALLLEGQADSPPIMCSSSPSALPAQQPFAQAGGDWRSTFDATLQAFEDRYAKLQQEVAIAKQQASLAPPPLAGG